MQGVLLQLFASGKACQVVAPIPKVGAKVSKSPEEPAENGTVLVQQRPQSSKEVPSQ